MRLDEIARPGLERRPLAFARDVGGQDEDGQVRLRPLLLETLEHLDAVEIGHPQIQQDQVGPERGAVPENLARVTRTPEIRVAGMREQLLHEAHHGPLVVDDQNRGVAKRLKLHRVSLRLLS